MKIILLLLPFLLSSISSADDGQKESVTGEKSVQKFTAKSSPIINDTKHWKIESISSKDTAQPKELVKFLGDLSVEVKIRNISKQPIQVGRLAQLVQLAPNKAVKQKDRDVYLRSYLASNGQSCHQHTYITIAPNQLHSIFYRDFSSNKGKQMQMQLTGNDRAPIAIGPYTLK